MKKKKKIDLSKYRLSANRVSTAAHIYLNGSYYWYNLGYDAKWLNEKALIHIDKCELYDYQFDRAFGRI